MDIQKDYKYIRFTLIEHKKKTDVYDCRSISGGGVLGIVKWYPPWRCYCYFPENSIYNIGCMTDIINFISQIEGQRKADNDSIKK